LARRRSANRTSWNMEDLLDWIRPGGYSGFVVDISNTW
jgi:hypothetical protein